jgi:hypothetical protein
MCRFPKGIDAFEIGTIPTSLKYLLEGRHAWDVWDRQKTEKILDFEIS